MSNISRIIYLVTYQGPEWNDPVVCMSDKKMVEKHVKDLNEGIDKGLCTRPFSSLSRYVFSPVALTEKAP